jgi:hypothetical protein
VIVEITKYRVRCDLCKVSDSNALGGDSPEDARRATRFWSQWRRTSTRDICLGCLSKRACRIFGHSAEMESGLVTPGGSAWCTRCRQYWPWS